MKNRSTKKMDDFLDQNKQALVEELGEAIGSMSSILEGVISKEPSETSFDEVRNDLIALAYKMGYMSAVFNQYFVLLQGRIEKSSERKIGFGNMLDKKES